MTITPAHASLGGPIHGGCQAVIMELVATQFLRNHAASTPKWATATLHTMNLEYLSAPSPPHIDVVVEILPHDVEGGHVQSLIPVQVRIESKGRCNSQGVLQFTTGGLLSSL